MEIWIWQQPAIGERAIRRLPRHTTVQGEKILHRQKVLEIMGDARKVKFAEGRISAGRIVRTRVLIEGDGEREFDLLLAIVLAAMG